MKIHVMSDLHLEFSDFTAPETDADVVVLAGDIGVGVHGLHWAATQKAFLGKQIIYLSGNHEYYGARLERTAIELRATAKELGIHYLDNDTVEIFGVRFIGATLWTDFELFGASHRPLALDIARLRLTDCRQIVYGTTGWIRPEKMIELHRISRRYIENRLDELPEGCQVVVTHHAPSMMSIPERHRKRLLSAAYGSNLDDLASRANLWIHGHVHESQCYELGNCRVVCNPRGYTGDEGGWGETYFKTDYVVEIDGV
jgi:Icc-related predicted phosphoesterase